MPFRWKGQAGQFTDAETGNVYCHRRYYTPKLGRWVSRDPIGFAGGINLYGYCGGDPVNFADPSGLQGYWHDVGQFLSGEIAAVNPVNWAKGLYGSVEYVIDNWDANGISMSPIKQLGSGFVSNMAFWNKDNPHDAGQSFMGDLMMAAPLIKRLGPGNRAGAAEGTAPAAAASNPSAMLRLAETEGSVCMRLVGEAEAMAVLDAGEFLESNFWGSGSGMTRVFESQHLDRMSDLLPNRTHVIEMPMSPGWTTSEFSGGARIGVDIPGYIVDVNKLNTLKLGSPIAWKLLR